MKGVKRVSNFKRLFRHNIMAAHEENARVFLRSRPGPSNPPAVHNFGYEKILTKPCDEGEVLAKTLCLSVDPYMRCRLNEDSGVDYVKSWQIGQTLEGGGVGIVLETKDSGFKPGDIVETFKWPFQKFAHFNPSAMMKVGPGAEMFTLKKVQSELIKEHPSLAFGILGGTGMTAIIGIQQMAHIIPGRNQTAVISGAAGACGSVAGQIAKLEGCGQVVGICGSDEKCRFLTDELGFDASINYKTTEKLQEKLLQHCPDGVDVYFDNVGGEISDQVIRCMTRDSHIVLCGQISQYNKDVPYPPPLPKDIQEILHQNNITRDRYLVFNYPHLFEKGFGQLETWIQEGKLKSRETVEVGLENAGKAFVLMMSGGNIGKQVVQVAVM